MKKRASSVIGVAAAVLLLGGLASPAHASESATGGSVVCSSSQNQRFYLTSTTGTGLVRHSHNSSGGGTLKVKNFQNTGQQYRISGFGDYGVSGWNVYTATYIVSAGPACIS